MITDTFAAICEAKVTRQGELAQGRREPIVLVFPGQTDVRTIIANKLRSLSSFLY